MSTDDMDARMQQAGERWREHNTDVAAIDLVAATAGDSGDASTMVPLVADAANHPRRRRWIWLSSAAGIAAAVAAALIAVQLSGGGDPKPQPAGTSDAAPLVGTQWQLVALRDGRGRAVGAVPPAAFQIDSAHTVGFPSTGCGKTTGHVTIHSGEIVLAGLKTEMAACPVQAAEAANAVLPQMQVVTSVLTGTVHWSISRDTLTLTKTGVGTLTYGALTQGPVTEPKALIGKWSLVTITSPTGASANAARPAYLAFGTSTFSGTDACNNISGDVTINTGRVDFADVASTAMGCVGADVNAESSAIDAVLGRNVTWSIQNDQLTLTKDGAGSLVYQRADIDPGFTGKTGGPSNQPSATQTK